MSVDREYTIRISTISEGDDPGKVADGLHEVGKEAEKASISHHELHSILHLIAREAGPEAATAMGGIATATIGGFGVAILTVKELIEVVKNLRDEAAETAKSVAQRASEMRDAIEESAKTWNDFVAGSQEADDAAKELEETYKRQKAALDNISEAHKKILDAMEQEELAAAQGNSIKEEEIKARFERMRQVEAGASGEAAIQAHQKYIDRLKSRQPDLDFAASAAAGDLSFLQKNKPVPAGFKIDEDLENKLRVELAGAKAAAQRAESGQETMADRVLGYSLKDRREQLATAQNAFDQYEKNRDALTRYNEQIATEQKLLADNEAARKANQETITSETNSLNLERDKRASQISGDAIQKAIEISQRAAAGGKINGMERGFVQQLGSLAAGQNLNLQSAERLFQAAANNPARLDQVLNRIAALIETNNQALANWIVTVENKLVSLQLLINSKGK